MKNTFKSSKGQKITDERIGPLLGEALGSLSGNGECPSPEDLAALSEGKISGEGRESLLLHIAGCDRCRAVYSMVCEIAGGEEPAANADFRWQARRLVPLAAAAGLILVIVSWPLITQRESGVNEAVSFYIQKPAALKTEQPATAKTEYSPQDRHPKTNEATPTIAARIRTEEKMESAPVLAAPAVPHPEAPAVRPAVPVPAKEIAYADSSTKAMESPKLIETGMAKAPSPTGQSKTTLTPPAGDGGSLAFSRKAEPAPKTRPEPEPGFSALPSTKSAETPAEPLNLHRKVEIDEGQKLRLSKADAATSDRVKIEGIVKDLKLDKCGFPLQDINKVVVQWTGTPRRKGQQGVDEGAMAAGGRPGEKEKVQANVSLEDSGVLTIDVQGTPPLRNNRRGKVAVGC